MKRKIPLEEMNFGPFTMSVPEESSVEEYESLLNYGNNGEFILYTPNFNFNEPSSEVNSIQKVLMRTKYPQK